MNIRKLHLAGSASITIFLLFLVCLAFPKNLVAQPAPPPIWQVTVTVTSSDPALQAAEIIFGVDPVATDGFDRGIDAAGNLVPGGMETTPYLNAFFHGERIFKRDIRQDGPWTLIVQTNRDFTLSWDVSEVPADVSITLDAGDDQPVVMDAGAEKGLSAGDYEIIIKSGAQIAASPGEVELGSEVTVTGEDFDATEDITIMLGDKEVATDTTDADGAFEATFTVTTDNVPAAGAVTVKAKGATSEKEAEASLIYSSPEINTVNAAVDGRQVVVTMTGGANGIATFSIEGVDGATDLAMTENPAGTYVGTFSPSGTIENGTATTMLSDGLNPASTATAPEAINVEMILFEVALNKGLNMISVPLADATVQLADGEFSENPIVSLSDLFDALGDASLIIYYDTTEKRFQSYTADTVKGSPVDIKIEGDLGLIVNMVEAKNITFKGDAWPGTLDLTEGLNLIGLPIDAGVGNVTKLVTQLEDNTDLIISFDTIDYKFVFYNEAVAATDIDITGDLGLIVKAKETQSYTLVGQPWSNPPAGSAPAADFVSASASFATPVLVVDGIITHEVTGAALNNLSVTVQNLSTGISITDSTGSSSGVGRFAISLVNISDYVAKVGDVLELNVVSQNGNFKVEPIQYTLSTTDIELGRVALGNLIANVIPSRTELLNNFPNPFNPETWIPFKLAKTADVVINIYDVYGHLMQKIDLGHLPAGLYSAKAKAAYWDGTNAFGERVASGVYFYNLQAGKFSATRRMVILK